MWVYIKLLVIFNIFLIHVLLVLDLDLLNGSGRPIYVSGTHRRRLCASLLLSRWCHRPVRRLRPHVLRALPLTGPLLDGFAEHLLLAPHKLLPLPCLPLADLLELIELGHLNLGLLPLLVSDPPLPLPLLDPHVLQTVPLLLLLEPLEVQGPPVQVILRDTPEVVVVLNYVVPIDLLLVAWNVKIVWHIGLRGAGLGVPHNLLLEGL